MKVEQFKNKNQFHLYGNGENSLQSYDSLVCTIKYVDNFRTIFLGRDWDYSNTTRKHVYLFLEEYADVRLNNVSNKRKFIQELINQNIIKYDENMF